MRAYFIHHAMARACSENMQLGTRMTLEVETALTILGPYSVTVDSCAHHLHVFVAVVIGAFETQILIHLPGNAPLNITASFNPYTPSYTPPPPSRLPMTTCPISPPPLSLAPSHPHECNLHVRYDRRRGRRRAGKLALPFPRRLFIQSPALAALLSIPFCLPFTILDLECETSGVTCIFSLFS